MLLCTAQTSKQSLDKPTLAMRHGNVSSAECERRTFGITRILIQPLIRCAAHTVDTVEGTRNTAHMRCAAGDAGTLRDKI